MIKALHYIVAILIFTLSVGQKDIQLLIQQNIKSKTIEKRETESKSEEGSEGKGNSENERSEEELESKRKKNSAEFPFGLSGITTSFQFSVHSGTTISRHVDAVIGHHHTVAKYIEYCALIFYDSIS